MVETGDETMTKEQLQWLSTTVAILIAVALASGMAGYIIAQWPTMSPLIKPAIVSGAFTIAAAMGGALVVFWQLRRQALNTIAANKHNEVLKLRKEVYEDAAKLILDAENAAATMNEMMRSMLTKAQGDISSYQYNKTLPYAYELRTQHSVCSCNFYSVRHTRSARLSGQSNRVSIPILVQRLYGSPFAEENLGVYGWADEGKRDPASATGRRSWRRGQRHCGTK